MIDGAVNGTLFLGYVQQQQVPTLTAGDIVVMDNLSTHKVAGVREAIAAVGARVTGIECDAPRGPRRPPARSAMVAAVGTSKATIHSAIWHSWVELSQAFGPQMIRGTP